MLDPAPSEAFVLCLLKSDLELLCLSPSSIPPCKTNRNANCQKKNIFPPPLSRHYQRQFKKKTIKLNIKSIKIEFLFPIYRIFSNLIDFEWEQIYKFRSNNRKIGKDWRKCISSSSSSSYQNKTFVETIWKFSWTCKKIHDLDHHCSSNKPQSEIINFRGTISFQTRHDLKSYTGKTEQT